jgi:acyl dehydratase
MISLYKVTEGCVRSVPRRMNGADLGSPVNQVNGAMNEVRHARISSAPDVVSNRLSVVHEELRARAPVAITSQYEVERRVQRLSGTSFSF